MNGSHGMIEGAELGRPNISIQRFLPPLFLSFLPNAANDGHGAGAGQNLVDRIFTEQIKELEVAEDIMTAPVMTCGLTDSLEDVSK